MTIEGLFCVPYLPDLISQTRSQPIQTNAYVKSTPILTFSQTFHKPEKAPFVGKKNFLNKSIAYHDTNAQKYIVHP